MSTKLPVHAAPLLGIRVTPRNRILVTGIHTRSTLDAVLELEVYPSLLVLGVAVSGTHIRGALVRASTVADVRVDLDVCPSNRTALVAVRDAAKPLRD